MQQIHSAKHRQMFDFEFEF